MQTYKYQWQDHHEDHRREEKIGNFPLFSLLEIAEGCQSFQFQRIRHLCNAI
jgi:hypothetical protein